MNNSGSNNHQRQTTTRLLRSTLFIVLALISNAYASEGQDKGESQRALCPCSYDEPFTSVLKQIKE